MKRDVILILAIIGGLAVVTGLSRAIDARRLANPKEYAEESLYVSGPTAKRLSLAFNGLASDWYWMRSLQYVGRKIVSYEDEHEAEEIDFSHLADLNMRLLPQLLQASTALDPQFMAPYEYGAMILPELDSNLAIELLNYGIAQNPSEWRLYHHLGYIYWQRRDYQRASEIYGTGAKLPGAPEWMTALSARMKGEGGSRDAAREMYRRLYETTDEPGIKSMVRNQIMRLDSLDEREVIRRVLKDFAARSGQCASSWRDVSELLGAARLRVDTRTGTPVDPSDTPYDLIKNGCDVGLNVATKVPLR
jgi:tetratricopeptide (TPR) repeat protein